MTKEEKLDILEKVYLEGFGHEMAQWEKEYLMMIQSLRSKNAARNKSLVGKRGS